MQSNLALTVKKKKKEVCAHVCVCILNLCSATPALCVDHKQSPLIVGGQRRGRKGNLSFMWGDYSQVKGHALGVLLK